jgi:hypothetical protein
MKRIGFFLIAILSFGFFLSSCQNEFTSSEIDALIAEIQTSTSKTAVTVADLPESITSEISKCYFETFIDNALLVQNKGYEITLGTGELVYFDTKPEMLQGEKLHTECGDMERPEMPNSNQFGGFNGHHGNGHNPNGDTTLHGHGNHPPHPPLGDTISIDELPASVFTYVETNYPDVQIERAKIIKDFYLVKLTSPTVLKFDLEGTFIEELPFIPHHCHGIPVAINDLLVPITDYITANYSTAEIKEAFQHPDRFEIRLLDGEQRIMLMFDIDGNFLFVRICD